MKVSINTNTKQNKAAIPVPIPFEREEQVDPTLLEASHDVTTHEVRYDPTSANSKTYKVNLQAFSGGTPERWLEFLAVLNTVIKGNCVTEGPQLFNLTRTALKGDARRVFETKATELRKETPKRYTQCIQAVTEHVFPKDALRRQRFYMRRHVHLTRKFSISEFFARFVEINEYLTQFPPFDGDEHKLSEEEIIEILYSIIPKAWKSKLMDHGFDPVEHSLTEFSEQLVRFETSDAISGNNTNGKQSGKTPDDNKKRKATEEPVPQDKKPAAKKQKAFCMLHGYKDHTTNACETVKEQIGHMKEQYEATSSHERYKNRQKWRKEKAQKANSKEEIHVLVQEAVKDAFAPFMNMVKKQSKKRYFTESDGESDQEVNTLEETPLGLEDIQVNETFALSALRNPPQKRVKTHNLSPMTTAKLEKLKVGTSSIRKARILLDSGSSSSIILEKFVQNLAVKNDTRQTWVTKGGTFVTNKKCLTTFTLDEFYENRQIQWNLYVDSTPGPHKYDMIIGRDLLSELGITLNFSDQTMTWDESTVRMKDPEEFADISSPLHEFFWHCEML